MNQTIRTFTTTPGGRTLLMTKRHGRWISLGCYDTPAQAARARAIWEAAP